MLFNKRPFPELDNEFRVLTAIENRQSPWEWDDDVPVERTLSTCCRPHEESRPSIDNVLQELYPFFNPSPPTDAVAKNPSTATSFIRRLDFGRIIMGSIISVYMLSWIGRGRLAQSWPVTAAVPVTTTWVPLSFTHYIWPIAVSLMAIGPIISWVVLVLEVLHSVTTGAQNGVPARDVT